MIEFDETVSFIEEMRSLDNADFDNGLVRGAVRKQKVNDGLEKVFFIAGFMSLGELHSLTEFCGDDGIGGEGEAASTANARLALIRGECESRGLTLRGGVFSE